MTKHWILTVTGKDQPGIVAGVTKILFKLGCNLEDSEMTRLAGEFAMMLIFSGSGKSTDAEIEHGLESLARGMHLSIHLKSLSPAEATTPHKAKARYLISVYGSDRSGIVYRISEALAKVKVNITDVHTHRSAPGRTRKEPSLYLMLLEVELPPRMTVSALEQKLGGLGKKLGVEVSVRSGEADVL